MTIQRLLIVRFKLYILKPAVPRYKNKQIKSIVTKLKLKLELCLGQISVA